MFFQYATRRANKALQRFTLGVSFLFLVGCGDGGSSSSNQAPGVLPQITPANASAPVGILATAATPPPKAVPVQITYVLPSSSTSALTSSHMRATQGFTHRNLQYISSSNTLISITVTPIGGSPTTYGPSACTSATCTISFTATPGPTTLAFTLSDGSSNVLSSFSTVSIIEPATINTLGFTANPVVDHVALVLANSTRNAGTPINDVLTVNAYDKDGNIITGTANYTDANGNPLTLTLDVTNNQAGGRGSVILQGPTYLVGPNHAAINAHYDGGWLTSSTISVTSSLPITGALGSATLTTIPSTQEFSTTSANSNPTSIVTGPDGNLWFAEYTTGKIGVMAMNGTMLHEYATWSGCAPSQIAVGADGAIYFTNDNGGTFVGKMTTGGALTQISTGFSPSAYVGLTLGPDGNMWVVSYTPDAVTKITPQGQSTKFTAGLTNGYNPSDISVGSDGNFWIVDIANHYIDKVTTAGQITQYNAYSATLVGGYVGIVSAPDGNLWFIEDSLAKIGVVSTSGTLLASYSSGLGATPSISFLTVGPDGNIWFTDTGNNTLGKSTMSGTITEYSTGITAGGKPTGITMGPDGNIWFTERGSNVIGRFVW